MVSMLNSLQIILHLPIMGVQEPANVMDTFSEIRPMVAFDVIIEAFDIQLLNDLIHTNSTEYDQIAIIDQVVALGYPTHNPILNLGFLAVLIFLYLNKFVIFGMFILPINKCCGRLKKLKKQIKNHLFFNEILVIFIEGYLELILAGLIIYKVPENN